MRGSCSQNILEQRQSSAPMSAKSNAQKFSRSITYSLRFNYMSRLFAGMYGWYYNYIVTTFKKWIKIYFHYLVA